MYTTCYKSPLGNILLASDDIGLTGLWFDGQKHFASGLSNNEEKETEILILAKKWLDIYFSKKVPKFKVPLHFIGTEFQKDIWEILCKIPYGKTITYTEIAKDAAKKRGKEKMSAQAVGNAIGRNKISVIVPCHRVIGKNGAMKGYAAGIDKKEKLLALENACGTLCS